MSVKSNGGLWFVKNNLQITHWRSGYVMNIEDCFSGGSTTAMSTHHPWNKPNNRIYKAKSKLFTKTRAETSGAHA